jgi:hypothetical protein
MTRRKKPDDTTTEVMPLDMTVMDLIAMLPRDVQQQLRNDVDMLTRFTFESFAEIASAFRGVRRALHYDVYSPKKADSMTKAIRDEAAARKEFLTTEWPDKIRREVDERIAKFKEAYFAAAQANMEPDQYAAFRKRFEDVDASK